MYTSLEPNECLGYTSFFNDVPAGSYYFVFNVGEGPFSFDIMADYCGPLDCLGEPNGTALPGTPCDDLDPFTTGEQWTAGCDCVGYQLCTNPIQVTLGENDSLAIGGAATTYNVWYELTLTDCVDLNFRYCDDANIPYMGPTLPLYTACPDNGVVITGTNLLDYCLGSDYLFEDVPPGTYYLRFDHFLDTQYQLELLTDPCVEVVDCNGMPNGPALPGTPCDDNNYCTTGDVYVGEAPNCGCVGTPVAPPVIQDVSNSGPICGSGPVQLTVEATGYGTLSYNWSGPTGFTSLEQNPTIANASPFNSGLYTVSVSSCGTAIGATEVLISIEPWAGADGELTSCGDGAPVDLFNYLGGGPQAGGSWLYNGQPHGSTYDPLVDEPGIYQYQVSTGPGCAIAFAAVTVTELAIPDAGLNGAVMVCSNDAAFSLFAELGGTPDAGGSWTFASAPHPATYNPAVDAPGVYTYTVPGIGLCDGATATVTVAETNATLWYLDEDNDGAGTPGTSIPACSQPDGYVVNDNDDCPQDPLKTSPGICGCGVQDIDNDIDGTPDCIDGCPFDSNKTAPGTCGCGEPDADTDGDGLADCIDPCEALSNVVPGQACDDEDELTINDIILLNCDCAGTPVTCMDNGDCNDQNECTNDACVGNTCVYIPLQDSDGDGTCDLLDGCPNDPNKVLPGICGCDVSDMDTDTDGTADCIDGCPNDPNKTVPGICGCDVADTDSDGDLTADCLDGCPSDPNKTVPGACGCNVADFDTDFDGTADCIDPCPLIPFAEPGGPCDDGNALTFPDVYDAFCNCIGPKISCVVNGDCDDGDDCTSDACVNFACVYTPDLTDADGDGLLDCSEDACTTIPGTIGSACDDANDCTLGDVVTNDCQCIGTIATIGAISGPGAVDGWSPVSYSIAPVAGATGYTWGPLPGDWTGTGLDTPTIAANSDNADTTVSLCVTVSFGGCALDTCIQVTVTPSNGVNETEMAGAFSVRPNPTDGVFEIVRPANDAMPCRLVVLDATGREILGTMLVPGQPITRIDLHDAAAGIYTLRLSSGGVPAAVKLMVRR